MKPVNCRATDQCLEGAVKVREERMLTTELEDAPFGHHALDIVVLEDHVFLQSLDGKVLGRLLQLRKYHLQLHV